jgi:hypothetical protein
LDHESFDDAMETGSLIMQLFGISRLFSSAEGSEIFRSLWNNISVQTEDKATSINTTDGNVKEGLRGDIVLGGNKDSQAGNDGG